MSKNGKKWIAFNFNAREGEACSELTSKSELTEECPRKPTKAALPVVRKRSFDFEGSLKPKTVADLAVHPKKIKEVETWLQSNILMKPKQKTASFLLISGPSGSGKTVTVKVLCEALSISVSEWINPVDQDFEIFRGPNQIVRFTDFFTESKWSSLFCVEDKPKVILVEELPNAVIRSPDEFLNVLEDCYYRCNYPVIFICSDSSVNGNNQCHSLFSPEILNKFNFAHISFNPCAATMLKSALKRAHNLVQDNKDLFKTPSVSTVEAIIATSMGDIRSAVNQYYFAALLGTADLPVTTSSKKRKRDNSKSSIKSMSRDETLGLFHGLGRVLNPKRLESQSTWKLDCDLEKIVDEFSVQPRSFISFLFENYVRYFGDINDACKASDLLSFTQLFFDRWSERSETVTFALWISIMGLMVFNEHKISKWNQIKGPRKLKKGTNNDSRECGLPVTDIFYYNLINKKNKQFLL